MEVATTLYRDIFGCKCAVFARDLTHLTTAILNRKNKKSQMKLFQDFKRQFFWRNRRLILGDVRVERCSAKIRSMLLVRAEELNRFDMELCTVLLDLVASINSENCGQNCSSFMGRIYRSMPHECEAEFRVLAAFRGKPEFMKLLLNFGLLYSLPEGSPLVRKAAEEMMGNFMVYISSPDESYEFDLEEFTNLLKKCFFPAKEDGQIYKRMLLVCIGLHATAWSLHATHRNLEHDQAENFIECLRLYFNATCDPFLTVFDFRSVLYACCILVDNEHLFDAYAEEFDNLMPESPANTEPRKLSDLARCQIRHNLKMSNVPLPAAIEKLPLPRVLKDFVVGHKTDVSIRRVNASSKRTVTKSELAALYYQRPLF